MLAAALFPAHSWITYGAVFAVLLSVSQDRQFFKMQSIKDITLCGDAQHDLETYRE